jgi:endonuclease/exonuclease/phosphatase family metal-dependent hydrolase
MKRIMGLLLLSSSLTVQAAITIGTYNIRNFDYDERSRVRTDKAQLSTILKSLGADILSVEEVNNTKAMEDLIAAKMPGYDTALTNCGGAHGQKLGFIFNTAKIELLSFTEDLTITEPGTAGACDAGTRPLAIALFQIKATKQKFYGYTAHLKASSAPEAMTKRAKQYEILRKIVANNVAKTGVKDFYIAGDFNTTEYLNKGADYKGLTKIVSALGAKDLAANLSCSAYWWGGTDDGIETPSLLDHVIVSPGLLKTSGTAKAGAHCQKVSCREASLKDLGISYESVSDHCPITATIQ